MKTFFGFGSGSDFGKIVAMDRFDSGRSLSPIRQAEAYWTALLSGKGVPMRSQVDPRGLENILQYTFILERIAPALARFRLAGSHLTNIAGMEVRGMPLSAFFDVDARDHIGSLLNSVFDAPAIVELGMVSTGQLGRSRVQARMILLPLKSDLGDISRALGVIVCDGQIGKTPRRFTIADERIRAFADIPTAPRPARQSEMGFAEQQNAFRGPAQHLRLVSSRDD